MSFHFDQEGSFFAESAPQQFAQSLLSSGQLPLFSSYFYIQWPGKSPAIKHKAVAVSDNVKTILGYPAQDFTTGQMHFSDLIHPAHRPRVVESFTQHLKENHIHFQNQPYKLKHKDGHYIWVVDLVSVNYNAQHQATNIQSFVLDISDRIKTEIAIIDTRTRMELLYEVIARLNRADTLEQVYQITIEGAKAILRADRASVLIFGDDGKVHFVAWDGLSEQYRSITDGHCPWQQNDLHANPIFIPDVAQSDLDRSLKQTILNEGIRSLGFIPLPYPGGLLGKFMVYYNTPRQTSVEELHLAQVLADNLSAIILRMRALKQALQSEEKYRSIFESISEGIYQTTFDGKFLTVNPAFAKILGFNSTEELLKQGNIKNLYLQPETRQHLIRLIEQNGILKNVEVQLKRKDGSPIWVLMNDRPIYDAQGTFLYFEGSIIDITEQKKARDEIKTLNEFQQLILTFASEYINVPLDQLDQKINEALEMLGKFTGVDRVYLFDYFHEQQLMNSTYEWCAPGVKPEFENLQNISFDTFSDWIETHLRGEMIFVADTDRLPDDDHLKATLRERKIKTVVAVPIMQNGRCMGFVGFDSIKRTRKWTQNEISLIKLFAEIISNIKERKEKEEKILRNEEQLRVLINATPDIICFKDGQGRWLEANEADLKLFELEKVDYKGKTDRELARFTPFYKNALLTCETTDEKTWQKGAVSREEEIIPRPDGSVKIFDVIKVPIFKPDGSRKGLVVFGRDITSLKTTEKLLARRLHFSNALNQMAKEIIRGTSQEEILAKTIRIIGQTLHLDNCLIFKIPSQQSPIISHWYRSAKQTNIQAFFNLPPSIYTQALSLFNKQTKRLVSHQSQPHPLFAKKGPAAALHSSLQVKSLFWYPIQLAEKENYILAFHYLAQEHQLDQEEIEFTDATIQLFKIAMQKIRFLEEQQRAAEEIKRLATLVEQSTSALVITDREGRIKYVNPTFSKMTGYDRQEVVNQILPILNSKFRDDILRTLFNGEVWRGRWVNTTKDGLHYHEEVVIFPIRDQKGEIVNFCKSGRNIDNETRLEEQVHQMQKMEAIGQLAGGVAHDFNNLLTVINGYAELSLSRISKDDPTFAAFHAILEAGKRAANLTNQLLAFSRKQIVKQEVVNLNQLILDTKKLIRRLIGEDIQIEFELSEPLSPILADKAQLDQILINLVVNARDALEMVTKPEFQKRIHISTSQAQYDEDFAAQHPGMRPGKYVVLTVSDNGVGMDEATRQRIFEPFFTTKEKGKGTGLGLSTVYGIVKQNNGTIYVYSEPGMGTTFKINWPVVEFKALTNSEERKQVTLNLKGTETILLVEDDEKVQNFARDALSNFGYRIFTASNGREALELVQKSNLKPDLLITDLVMPEMNGKALADKLQKMLPKVKVIFVSGYTDDHIVRNGMLEKGIHFIPKPYSAETLAAKVREILSA